MTSAGGDAAAGWRVLTVDATNTSDHPCSFGGYPELSFSTADGTVLPVHVVEGGGTVNDVGRRDYEIVPGSQLRFTMEWRAGSSPDRGSVGITTIAPGTAAAPGELHTELDITTDTTVNVTAWAPK